MRWLRTGVAVVLGYLVAAVTNMGWVLFWHVGPRAAPGWLLFALTVGMFACSGLAAGYLTGLVSGSGRAAAMLAGALLAVAGMVNLSLGAAVQPAWHTLLAIVVQAPALPLGARLWFRAQAR